MSVICEYGNRCLSFIEVTSSPSPLKEYIMYIDANEVAEELPKLSTSSRGNWNLLFGIKVVELLLIDI